MKTKNLFLIAALIAGLGLIPASRLTAQTFTVLHSFSGGSDGSTPFADLILSGNRLYGAATAGGSSGEGTVFKVNTDGTGFTNLYSFTATSFGTNSEGANPYAGLILSGNTLYGAAAFGGSAGNGSIFALNTDGTGFTNLHIFTAGSTFNSLGYFINSDGAYPHATLILSGNTLYGTAIYGGNSGYGTVFKVHTDGTGFTTLHSFTAGSGSLPDLINGDGATPRIRLALSGNTLYGAAWYGGSSGRGTVFALDTDGTGFRNLHSFTAVSGPASTNSDGSFPRASLILSGNTLYGAARDGGGSGSGTVFKVNTNGTGFTTLYSFTAGSGPAYSNNDGAFPRAALTLLGNTLYGTAFQGGALGKGTMFAVNIDGTGFTNLHSFTATNGPAGTNADGAIPFAGLISSGNTLYGAALYGGSSGYGTIFSLSFPPPQLTIISSGANVILTWPTDIPGFSYAGFALQSTTNLVSPVVWTTVSPGPVGLNGLNTVTNSASSTQQFYRLSPPPPVLPCSPPPDGTNWLGCD